MEIKVVTYKLWYEDLGDGTKRVWFKANGVLYSTVRSIQDAYPDADIREEES